jgi:hypothetical protein
MRRSGKRRASNLNEEKLNEIMAQYPDYYLSELAVALKASRSGVFRALKRYGITRKKKSFSSKNERKTNGNSFLPSSIPFPLINVFG